MAGDADAEAAGGEQGLALLRGSGRSGTARQLQADRSCEGSGARVRAAGRQSERMCCEARDTRPTAPSLGESRDVCCVPVSHGKEGGR